MQEWEQNSVVSSRNSQAVCNGCSDVCIPLLMGCDASIWCFRKTVLEVERGVYGWGLGEVREGD